LTRAEAAPALLPGALVVVFGFQAGGFFPGAVAIVAVALAIVLVLRLTLAQRPFAGGSIPLAIAGAGLGLFAVWTLVSAAWSQAPGRALLEYDRVLLYLLAFVLLGCLARTVPRVRWAVRGLVAGAFVVCVAGLVSRLLPEVWPLGPDIATERLSFPLTYWNAMGLVAALGAIAAFTMSSDAEEAPLGRVLGAAALPVLATALLLTFSRGAIVAGAAGLLVALAAGRGRGLLGALLVGVPSVGLALRAAYDADALTTGLVDAAVIAQGRDVALVVVACTLGALVGRAVLLPLDARLAALRVPWLRRRTKVGLGAVALVAAVVAAVVLGAPAALERQYDGFVDNDGVATQEVRDRLLEPSANGRIDQWRVARRGFEAEPLRGTGAGTYALLWDRYRPYDLQVEDGHSLYLEVLAELGIVGFVLVVVPILLILGAFAWRARGPDRAAGAALLGAGVAWAVHAGIDWDWEMPAVTAWFFAAGGLALASGPRPEAAGGRRPLPNLARIGLALGCLLVAVVPAQIMFSEARLDDGRAAFALGDCAGAVDSALGSIDALAVRADPYVILGYCDVRLGLPELAVRATDGAVARDPGNWETHYGRALVLGAAGLDPRPSARRALALNPLEPLAREAVEAFATEDPQTWRRRALEARLPVE
jgi:O-antigen ligase